MTSAGAQTPLTFVLVDHTITNPSLESRCPGFESMIRPPDSFNSGGGLKVLGPVASFTGRC